jgi:hypothetical protein
MPIRTRVAALFIAASTLLAISGTAFSQNIPPGPAGPGGLAGLTRIADGYSGAECGAKITAALAAGGTGALVDISTACGSITTPITVGQFQTVHFLPGSYTYSAPITVNSGSLRCDPSSDNPGGTTGSCYFRQSNGANLPVSLIVTGIDSSVVNATFDGNKANNPSMGPILKNTGLRSSLDHLSVMFGSSYGVQNGDGTGAPSGLAANYNHLMSLGNTLSGVLVTNANDVMFTNGAASENNGGWGYDLCNSEGIRWQGTDDAGGNTAGGIRIRGTAPGTTNTQSGDNCWSTYAAHDGANNNQILGLQYGDNQGPDIQIIGWDYTHNALVSTGNTIVGNQFIGGSTAHPDSVDITDSGINTITGNTFGLANYASLVHIAETVPSRELPDVVTGNAMNCYHCTAAPVVGTASTLACANATAGTTGYDCSILTFRGGALFGSTGQAHFDAAGHLAAPGYTEALTTPSSSSAACIAGQFTDDANYHYVCTATNTWKRVALSAF